MGEEQPSQEAGVRYSLYRSADQAAKDGELELIVNSMIDVEGDRAHASSVRLRLGGTARAPEIVSCERVEDDLVRESDGVWEIVGRVVAGSSEGWAP